MLKPHNLNTSNQYPDSERHIAWVTTLKFISPYADDFELHTIEKSLIPQLEKFGTIKKRWAIFTTTIIAQGKVTNEFINFLVDDEALFKADVLLLRTKHGECTYEQYDTGAHVTAHLTDEEFTELAALLKQKGINPDIADWR